MASIGSCSSSRAATSAASWHSLLTLTEAWSIPSSCRVAVIAAPRSKSRQPKALLATTDGACGEADLVEVDVDAEHAPRFAVEGDGAGRTAGPGPADRVELADQPPRS